VNALGVEKPLVYIVYKLRGGWLVSTHWWRRASPPGWRLHLLGVSI